MRARNLGPLVLGALLALGACKIDSTVYRPPADDDDDGDAAVDDGDTDAPPAGIYVVVNPGTTTVAEGGQVTVRIKLSEAPPVDRMIAVQGNTQLVPTPATVTFTPTNWMNERTIILAAGQDDDADDSPVTVLFNGMGDVGDGSAMVMITDDDNQMLVVSPPGSLGITEGNTGQVTVQLAARPSANVVVAVSSMDTAVATSSAATLTFMTSNWNMPQTITVTGTQDANTGNDSTLLILDPATEGIPTHTVAINVTDDDILAIDASPGNLGTIVEGGGPAQFGVRLTQMPPGDVVVSLAATPSAPVNLSQSSLTFTTGNYATVQMVSVTAPQDPNATDEQVTIRLSATGLADRFVQVAVDDNDTQVIQVTPNPSLGVSEGGGGSFAVVLAFEPAGPVVVDIDSSDPSVVTVDTNQLTFGPSDWNQPQNVNVDGVQDLDLANETATVSFNAAAQGLTTNRTVDVTDDDMQVIDVNPTTIFVAEGGSDTFDVKLSYQPSGNVTVTVSVSAGNSGDISAGPTPLVFTPSNYATPQPVTVMALQDADTTNEIATVTVASTGLSSRPVTVNISDDDSLGIVVTPAMVQVTEGGASMNINVSLAAMPPGNITVNLATMPGGVATLGAASLNFTMANYATPQPVSVTGVQDGDGLDETTTIHLTATGLDEKTVPVSVVDDDVVSPVLSPNPVTIIEGQSGQVSLTLSRDPGRSVIVEVLGFGATDFEVQPESYFFEGSNDWNIPQIVNLYAYDDDETDGETEDILFAIQSAGTSSTLRVNVTDPTIHLGFPPPHSGSAGLTGLEAWRDGQMPQCFLVEKLAVDVSASTMFGNLSVGLYATGSGDTQPYTLLWSSGTFNLGPGAGLRLIDVPDTNIYSMQGAVTTWIAAEATPGVSLKTKAASGPHCVRGHMFGDFMPNPFNSSGTGGVEIMDAGPSDAGTVNVTCNQTPPVAVWIIGRDTTCINPL